MQTQLFLNGQEVELNELVQFLLDKQFLDLSNPTVIMNDCSKTVSIPFTEKNNKIFGYIYKPERIILSNGNDNIGMFFDPLKKIDFQLIWNSMVLMTGYAKMNEIKQDDEKGSYEITLFGLLGKVFQEMKKITFDTTTTDTDYLINGKDYVYSYINKNVVNDSWTDNSGQRTSQLIKRGQPHYRLCDIIGWAPNNSFSQEFDYKTFEYNKQGNLFTDVLTNIDFKSATGIDSTTVIPNGMLPREIGEYRSYLQLPFIYWNKLFLMFLAKAEEVTGYTFELDDSWFNTSNPDWYKLVYMLQPFDVNKYVDHKVQNLVLNDTGYSLHNLVIPITSGYYYSPRYDSSTIMAYRPAQDNIIYDANEDLFTLPDDEGILLSGQIKVTYHCEDPNGALRPGGNAKWELEKHGAFVTEFMFYNENDVFLTSYKFSALTGDTTLDKTQFVDYLDLGTNQRFDFTSEDDVTVNIPYSLMLNSAQIGTDKFRIKVNTYMISNPPSPSYLNSDAPLFRFWVYDNEETWGTLEIPYYTVNSSYTGSSLSAYRRLRSFNRFTMNDLWNKDFNIFDEIIKYCKKFRIYIYADETEKKLYFTTYKKYFESYTITDWTDKLDRSREMVIKPITFENKYVLFNYEDNKTKLGNDYRDKYGIDYGEYRLITDYNFNTDTTELFKECKEKAAITNTDNCLSWTNLYDNKTIVYSLPNEISVYNKDKDNKQVDTFGCFYYSAGLATFNTEPELAMRSVKISDDTVFQQSRNTYFYTQTADDTITVETYQKLDIVYGTNLCLFNTPKENYTYLNNYAEKTTIYSRYWENYINERYNVLNKIVTCYLNLNATDWTNFEFKNFVLIDNVLYMVNRIFEWDVTSNDTTKVELVSVSDITGYTL